MINNLFFKHPNENNMTYCKHIKQAWYMAFKMLLGFIVLFIHGIVPGVFTTTGSNIIKELHKDILINAPPLTTEELNNFLNSRKVI